MAEENEERRQRAVKRVAVIFAGGTGERMGNRTRPKQFLKADGKTVLEYTLEHFQRHELIDAIVLVSLESWTGYCQRLAAARRFDKLAAVVPGGGTGQESIRKGLEKAGELYAPDTIVLIHDGVRPLIDGRTITAAIACAEQNGSAITVAPATETVLCTDTGGRVSRIEDRADCRLARAPQCFRLGDILRAHARAAAEGLAFIDSASLMSHYGYGLYTVNGPVENIKITTELDFQMFCAILHADDRGTDCRQGG